MRKNYIPLLLLTSLFLACEARREPVTTQPEQTIAELDTASLTGLDTLNTELTDSAGITPDTTAPKLTKPDEISNRQVGPVKINMPITDIKKTIPPNQLKEVKITREGRGYKAYEIRKNPADAQAALRVEELCEPTCRVWRVQVLDSTYKTAEGIGIGSTLGEVKKHYPVSYLGTGETEIVAVSEAKKITFMLDVSKLPAKEVPRLNLKNTPDQVKVKGIMVQ